MMQYEEEGGEGGGGGGGGGVCLGESGRNVTPER